MQILCIHNYYQHPGGEDIVFENETQLLKNYGHQVATLTFSNNEATQFWGKAKLSYQTFYNTQAAQQLETLLKNFKPDLIHIHNFFRVASPAVLYIAKKYKVPVVMTLHNYRLICSQAMLLRNNQPCELCTQKTFPPEGVRYKCFGNSALKTAQITLMTGLHKQLGTWRNKVSKYICLTDFARSKIIHSSLKLSRDQVIVKHNFVPDYGPLSGARENYFLFIGRLSEEKGVHTLLEAAQSFKFPLKIIGAGELEPSVRQAAVSSPNIEYLGFQKKEFIIEKLKKARALIFPSIWYEGMPMTLLESFSTGTPIIFSDMPNINEIVIDKHNGLAFIPKDAHDLIKKIEYFAATPSEDFYVNARQTYLDHYTPEKNYQYLINIYNSVLGASS